MPQSAPALQGLHHVTAVTADAPANFAFYTRVLGMRLVKKTVNQDDVSAYHLFYADELARPGTDLTFFDWGHIPPARPGAGVVTETALRVLGGAETLEQWRQHFDAQGVAHQGVEAAGPGGRSLPSLAFTDPEGQRLRLIAEPTDRASEFHPWSGSPLPAAASIVGLSEVTLTVRDPAPTAQVLTEVLGFRVNADNPTVYEVGAGGQGAQLRLVSAGSPGAQGAGGVHHVAWAVEDVDAQRAWHARLVSFGLGSSGIVDRHYFQSVYFRLPGGILFELATNGPGFTADGEPMEHLGEKLSLPPFLEGRRAQIEAGLKPLDTARG